MDRRNLEFGCAVIAIGLLAGLAGAATTVLLNFIEHLTYHYSLGSLLDGVTGSSPIRRAVGPMVGGALAGFGWWLLRRRVVVPTVSEAITRPRPIPRMAMAIDSMLQVLLVGSGASLGRENAPRELAVALGDFGTARWALTARDREILLGCAAGAGLAAVYSVPIGGALFALRVVLRTWNLRAVGTALVTSSLAVAVAAAVTHDRRELAWPDPQLSYLLTAVALVLAPLALGVGLAFNRIVARARSHDGVFGFGSHDSWLIIPAIAAAGLLVGICAHWFPELPGNGSSILKISLDSSLTLASAAALLLLKPLLTAAFLRAGAMGGLLTPALATGAAMGAVVALSINSFTDLHLDVASVSLTCAAGVLTITQGTPLWAAIFVWELAQPPVWLLIVFAVSSIGAHGLHRIVMRTRTDQKTTV